MSNHIVIDLQAEDAGRPHWLNREARFRTAMMRLEVLETRLSSLLSKPPHVLIDPLWATTTDGEFLHHEFDAVVRSIEWVSEQQIRLPKRERWDLRDTGGGITRDQLRELASHIDFVRRRYFMS